MARATKEVVDEAVEDDGKFRLSISLEPSLRRNIRIAAAYADMTVGEWASNILERYANKATEEGGE